MAILIYVFLILFNVAIVSYTVRKVRIWWNVFGKEKYGADYQIKHKTYLWKPGILTSINSSFIVASSAILVIIGCLIWQSTMSNQIMNKVKAPVLYVVVDGYEKTDTLNQLREKNDELQEENLKLKEKIETINWEFDKLLKENTVLQGQLSDKMLAISPIRIIPLTALNSTNNNFEQWDSCEEDKLLDINDDVFYSCIIAYPSNSKNGSAEYFINGKYSKLMGSIAPYKLDSGELSSIVPFEKDEELANQAMSTVQIYGDDKLLYESSPITTDTDIISFQLELSQVKYLKIVQKGDYNIPILLIDWMLT